MQTDARRTGKGEGQVFDLHAAIEKNRQVYTLQHSYAYFAMFGICEYFDHIGKRLQSGRNANGKTLVSLIPFLILAQRQAMSAFERMASCRSYDGWLLLRPALECVLITGKWIDDPENAAIWNAREARKTEYIRHYAGKGLISKSLPRAEELKAVLDRLNDEFMHANQPYYRRHTSAVPADGDNIYLKVDFFDNDEDVEAHSLAFLHLMTTLLDGLDAMFATALPSTGAHVPRSGALRSELQERASRVRHIAPELETTLAVLGLWPASGTN